MQPKFVTVQRYVYEKSKLCPCFMHHMFVLHVVGPIQAVKPNTTNNGGLLLAVRRRSSCFQVCMCGTCLCVHNPHCLVHRSVSAPSYYQVFSGLDIYISA